MIGDDAIIGQSVRDVAEAKRAVEGGADYVGIGAVWDTKSKDLKGKKAMGPEGVGEILDMLSGTGVEAVAIGETIAASPSTQMPSRRLTPGGIHLPNLPQLLHASTSPYHHNILAGIAVISDIVASNDPTKAAKELKFVMDSFVRGQTGRSKGIFRTEEDLSPEELVDRVGTLMRVTREHTPLVNQVSGILLPYRRLAGHRLMSVDKQRRDQ